MYLHHTLPSGNFIIIGVQCAFQPSPGLPHIVEVLRQYVFLNPYKLLTK